MGRPRWNVEHSGAERNREQSQSEKGTV